MSSQQQVNAVLSLILAACCWENQSVVHTTPLPNPASWLYSACPGEIVEIDCSSAKSVRTNFSSLIRLLVLFQLAQQNTAERLSSEPALGKGMKEFDSDGNGHTQEEEWAGLQDFVGAQAQRGYSSSCCPFSLINVLGVAANLWSQAAVAAPHCTQLLLGSSKLPAAPRKEPPTCGKSTLLYTLRAKQVSNCSYMDNTFQHCFHAYTTSLEASKNSQQFSFN